MVGVRGRAALPRYKSQVFQVLNYMLNNIKHSVDYVEFLYICALGGALRLPLPILFNLNFCIMSFYAIFLYSDTHKCPFMRLFESDEQAYDYACEMFPFSSFDIVKLNLDNSYNWIDE